jgi:hypothetical protein
MKRLALAILAVVAPMSVAQDLTTITVSANTLAVNVPLAVAVAVEQRLNSTNWFCAARVDYGDGNGEIVKFFKPEVTVRHAYAAAGTYRVSVVGQTQALPYWAYKCGKRLESQPVVVTELVSQRSLPPGKGDHAVEAWPLPDPAASIGPPGAPRQPRKSEHDWVPR